MTNADFKIAKAKMVEELRKEETAERAVDALTDEECEWGRAFQDYYSFGGSGFQYNLFHLLTVADLKNRERIRAGFPEAVRVFELWKEHGTYFFFCLSTRRSQ